MHTWDLTHSLAGHDLFIRGMRLADRGGAYCPPSSECGMSHVCQHDSFVCRKWLIHVCDMSHSYVMTIDIRVTCRILTHMWWLLGLWDMSHSYVWHDLYLRVTWLIRTCDMTDTVQTYGCHAAFMCVTWLIHMCDMTRPYVQLIHVCNMTCFYAGHDSFTCVTWLIHMCDTTHRSRVPMSLAAPIYSALGSSLWSFFPRSVYIYIYIYIRIYVYMYTYMNIYMYCMCILRLAINIIELFSRFVIYMRIYTYIYIYVCVYLYI